MIATFITAFEVLLPVLFVLALGFWAGRAKKFDSDQVAGINELVLDYAFPALFLSRSSEPRAMRFFPKRRSCLH